MNILLWNCDERRLSMTLQETIRKPWALSSIPPPVWPAQASFKVAITLMIAQYSIKDATKAADWNSLPSLGPVPQEKSLAFEAVFLTNYADFNYAQKAVELKVLNPYLKPIDPDRGVSSKSHQ